jgi:hypothetical protein
LIPKRITAYKPRRLLADGCDISREKEEQSLKALTTI